MLCCINMLEESTIPTDHRKDFQLLPATKKSDRGKKEPHCRYLWGNAL